MSKLNNNESYENILINIENENTNETDYPDNDLQKILEEIGNYNNFEEQNQNQGNMNDLLYNMNSDTIFSKIMDYKNNYTVKELLIICDYYGLMKEVRLNKFKKDELINFLLDFEENTNNSSIVYKRKLLWYFVHELKNDKFMKKYIISSI
jgi:hypothetical protein